MIKRQLYDHFQGIKITDQMEQDFGGQNLKRFGMCGSLEFRLSTPIHAGGPPAIMGYSGLACDQIRQQIFKGF